MISNFGFILVVFLQLVMISICITKILDFVNYHIGHQKRLLVSVIVLILLQNILVKKYAYLQENKIILFLSIAISYLILFELYSLLYRAISLQILLHMRLSKKFKMQRKNLLLIYPNGGARYIWETRLNGLLKSQLLARENVLIKITGLGKILRSILVIFIQIMNVKVEK